MEEAYHQYSGGHAVWTCHIINTEEGVHYMATKTTQGVVGGCIYLKDIPGSLWSFQVHSGMVTLLTLKNFCVH